MDFKDFLSEASSKRVKIQNGNAKGHSGTIVFSKKLGDVRYYVVELDQSVKGEDVVIVYNGDYDFI